MSNTLKRRCMISIVLFLMMALTAGCIPTKADTEHLIGESKYWRVVMTYHPSDKFLDADIEYHGDEQYIEGLTYSFHGVEFPDSGGLPTKEGAPLSIGIGGKLHNELVVSQEKPLQASIKWNNKAEVIQIYKKDS